MMQNKDKKYIKKFMILLFWLGVWQITAVCVDNFLLVVTPLQALRALLTLWNSGVAPLARCGGLPQAFCWERFWDCC